MFHMTIFVAMETLRKVGIAIYILLQLEMHNFL